MIFTSYTYLAFLALVFLVHWNIPVRLRKPLLIVASYAFYCSHRWEYGFLLLGVSLFNWWFARRFLREPRHGSLLAGIGINLLPLLVFKYSEFFANTAIG